MRIKLCGVRTVDDALLCAAEGADEIGVVFAPKSKRRVTVGEAKAIRDALPSRLPLVGVFLDAEIDDVLRVAREVGLKAAQRQWTGPAAAAELPVYAALQVTGESALQPRPGAARILLDGPAGGSGKSFAWELAARRTFEVPVFIAGGLTPENVAAAIGAARPAGVDVASGIENAQGYKDQVKVRAFVHAVRACR